MFEMDIMIAMIIWDCWMAMINDKRFMNIRIGMVIQYPSARVLSLRGLKACPVLSHVPGHEAQRAECPSFWSPDTPTCHVGPPRPHRVTHVTVTVSHSSSVPFWDIRTQDMACPKRFSPNMVSVTRDSHTQTPGHVWKKFYLGIALFLVNSDYFYL